MTPPSTLLISVSPTGDDAGAGDHRSPVRTLEEARRRVRARPAGSGASVLLRTGTWTLDGPFQLGPEDSGSPDAPVRWRAAPGARPVISGGSALTVWTRHDRLADTYAADIPGVRDSRQLFIDGTVAERAGVELDRGQIAIEDRGIRLLTEQVRALADVERPDRLEVDGIASFTHRVSPVSHREGDLLVMRQPAWNNNTWGYDTLAAPFEGGRLRLRGTAELLQPGQWCIDADRGLVLLRLPEGDHPDRHDIVLGRLESLLEIAGTVEDPVHDVEVSGITFSHTTWLLPGTDVGYASQQAGTFLAHAFPVPPDRLTSCQKGCPAFEATRNHWQQMPAAVQICAAERLRIEHNTFRALGQVGLGIGNDANAHSHGPGLGARDIEVRGNLFTELSGSAVVVGGVQPDAHHPSDERLVVARVSIEENLVRRVARDAWEMPGILATYVDELRIVHNEVADLAYDGIDVGFGWGANDPDGSPDYRERGLYAHQPVYTTPTTLRATLIARNLVHHTKKEFHDGGSIYALSANPGARIEENHTHDNAASVGLYLDEGSRYLTLERNVVTESPWLFTNTYGENHTDDNTFAGNWHTQEWAHLPEPERHDNVLVDNVRVDDDAWPVAAQRVMFHAGIPEDARGFAEASWPVPVAATLRVTPAPSGGDVVVLEVENLATSDVALDEGPLEVPDGWHARRTRPLPATLGPGRRAQEHWELDRAPGAGPSPVVRTLAGSRAGRAFERRVRVVANG